MHALLLGYERLPFEALIRFSLRRPMYSCFHNFFSSTGVCRRCLLKKQFTCLRKAAEFLVSLNVGGMVGFTSLNQFCMMFVHHLGFLHDFVCGDVFFHEHVCVILLA